MKYLHLTLHFVELGIDKLIEGIIKSFESGDFILKGCNMDVYNKYIQRLKTTYDQQGQNLEQNDENTQYFDFTELFKQLQIFFKNSIIF